MTKPQFPMPGDENFQPLTRFWPVHTDTPVDGCLLLVRLKDDTYRFGMMLKGRFANFEPNTDEFVTMAHADRITHYMIVVPPVPFTAKAEAQTPQAESLENEAAFQHDGEAPSIEEAAMAMGQDLSEDVYL